MKIKSIKRIKLDEPVNVCDLTVNKYHNYKLTSGVFSHNSHIECLLLSHFFKHMKPLIEYGLIYIGLPPLYRVTEKGKRKYFRDEEALSKFFINKLKGIIGNDKLLLSLVGNAVKIKSIIEKNSSQAGISPIDIANGFNIITSYDSSSDDWLNAFTDRMIEYKNVNCEGVTLVNIDADTNMITALEPSGRYSTTIINEDFYNVIANTYTEVETLVGREIMESVISKQIIEIEGNICQNIYDIVKTLNQLANKGVSLQYVKGLGENEPDELGVTTLDRSTRRLLRISVDDFDTAGEFIGNMMSKGTVSVRSDLIKNTFIDKSLIDA
jgi:DNA gyrase/topoisomerase IV subunit B